MTRFAAKAFLILTLATFSCSNQTPDKIKSKYRYPLVELNAKKLDDLTSNRSGKILVLFVWSRWSVNSGRSFPVLVELHREYSDRSANVDFVGISTDDPSMAKEHLIPFLTEMEVEFPNYIENFRDEKDFIESLDPNWRGGVPSVFIFDQDGIMKSTFVGKSTAPVIRYVVESLLSPDYVPGSAQGGKPIG